MSYSVQNFEARSVQMTFWLSAGGEGGAFENLESLEISAIPRETKQ